MAAVLEDPGPPVGAVGSLVSSLVDNAVPVGQVDNVTDPDGPGLGIAIVAADPNFTVYYSVNNGATWTPLGAVSTAAARLLAANATNRIYAQPNPNVNGSFASAITFRAWDQSAGVDGSIGDATVNGGSSAFSASTDGIALSVTPVNDAPVLDPSRTPALATVPEDAAAPVGAVGSLVSSLVDNTVPVGQVDNVTDLDGPGLGVALVGSDANFTVYYSINNGATWTALGAVSTSSARLLAANATNRIYAQPNPDVNGSFASAVTFRAWDQSAGVDAGVADVTASGGTSAFSVNTDGIGQFVTPVNDAPVLDASRTPTMATLLEDPGPPAGAVGTLVSNLVDNAVPAGQVDNVSDPDGPALGVALVGSDANFTVYYSINNGATWTALGAVGTTSARLLAANATNRIYAQPNANVNGSFASAVTFRAWDQSAGVDGGVADVTASGGITAFSANTDGIAQFVTPVNDAPVLDASRTPTMATLLEDPGPPTGAVGTLISSLVDNAVPAGQVDNVSDLDGPGLGVALVGSDANFTVYYSTNNGTTWTALGAVSTAAARLLAANGTNRIYAQPNANVNGSFASAVTFRAWDQSAGVDGSVADATVSGGTSAFSANTDGISQNVTAVNDAPSATNLSAAQSYTENVPLTLSAIVASDVDNATLTATLTLSNPGAGALSTATSGAVTSTYTSGTGVWTASGAIADVNTLLAGITFTPALNFNSNFSIATSVSDGALSVTGSKSMTGIPVNDAPVLDASKTPTMATVLEDPGLPLGAVGTLVSSLVDYAAPAGQMDNVTDPDGPGLGVALVGSDTNFTVYYSVDNGTTWTALGAVSTSNALMLAANTTNRIYAQPNANVSGSFASAVTFRAWDQSAGVNGGRANVAPSGGNSAFSAVTDGVSQSVTPVNDAPVLDASKSPTLLTVLANSGPPAGAVGTLVSSLVDYAAPTGQVDNVTDVDGPALGIAVVAADAANGTWWYTSNGGTDWYPLGAVTATGARLLSADAATRVCLQPNAGFSGFMPTAITFRAWDQSAGIYGTLADASINGGATAFSIATDVASLTVGSLVGAPPAELPRELALSVASANPSPGLVQLWLALPRASSVRMSVVDAQGREVALLADETLAAGRYPITWDGRANGSALPGGIYFVRLATTQGTRVRKVALLR